MLKRIKVLLIEDDIDTAFFEKSILKKCKSINFEVVHTVSIKESLELIKKENFNIILLDLKLPNGEGIEVFNAINNKCIHTPIIIISGYEKYAVEAVRAGAQDYLIKPININQLIRSINYSIARKKAEEECEEKKKANDKEISDFLEFKLNEWNQLRKKTKIHYQKQIQRLEKASLNTINEVI